MLGIPTASSSLSSPSGSAPPSDSFPLFPAFVRRRVTAGVGGCSSRSAVLVLAACFLLLNCCLSLLIISQVERERHSSDGGPASASPPASSLLLQQLLSPLPAVSASPPPCPITSPLRPCVSSSLPLSSSNLSALQAAVQQSLSDIAVIRAALLPSASASSPSASLSPPELPPATRCAESAAVLPFLYIGIPTVSRASADSGWYLNASLQSIAAQLPVQAAHPLSGQVHVLVMNNNAAEAPHTAFDAARLEFSSSPVFHFAVNAQLLKDEREADRDAGTANVPGWKVRKQTRDVVATMRAAAGLSEYYMVQEDDFTWCPRLLPLLLHMVHKAAVYDPHFLVIKFSFGMNGYVLHSADIPHLSAYLLQHQRRRPPDHLMTEWSRGETAASAAYKQQRPALTFRYNLLHHLGTVSSLRGERQPEYPPCWHEMNSQVVFDVEAFSTADCGHDDFTPCWSRQQIEQSREPGSGASRWPPPFNVPDSDIAQAQHS